MVYGNDKVIDSLLSRGMTIDDVIALKKKYYNESIADLVKNSNDLTKIVEVDRKLIRKDSPIFQESYSKFGRAQFFAGSKFIGSLEISTIWFNVFILWLMTFILYIALVNDWLRKILRVFSKEKQNGV